MDNIIECCNTYYGTHHGGLKNMFADMTYLQLDDGAFNTEDCNQNSVNEVSIVDIGRLASMDEDSYFDSVDVQKGLSTPMDQALTRLYEIMVEITTECTTHASVELCDHATSLFQGVESNIHHLRLA